jgi:hypothetical protein
MVFFNNLMRQNFKKYISVEGSTFLSSRIFPSGWPESSAQSWQTKHLHRQAQHPRF